LLGRNNKRCESRKWVFNKTAWHFT